MKTIDNLIDDSQLPRKNILKRAFKLAKASRDASDWYGPHLGAVITYKNKILSVGWNKTKESALQKKFNKYRSFDQEVYRNSEHAEIHAIRTLLHSYNIKDLDMNKVSIYIYREWKNGKPSLAKPCAACEAAIRGLGIKHVFYTGDESIVYEIYNKRKSN